MKNKVLIKDIMLLTKRSLIAAIRNPYAYIPNFIISLFFLFVYTAGIGAVTDLPTLEGVNYTAFILPVSVVSAAIGAATGAVQTLVKDLESGYFARLLLTPTSRLAIVLGPIITGMLQLVVQTILLTMVAILMGVRIYRGIGGFIIILVLVTGLGLAFTGYAATVALVTKSSHAVQMSTMIFFPMLFLSTTFVPLDLIETGWLRIAAIINPTTYIFEGMRALLIEGWRSAYILYGFLVGSIASVITITIATKSAARAFNGE
ncbi:ABC-2 type transport system permease protein [Natronincola peptidivorans]|uniref:Transport permease protein n=1 Tax=Natronincola peptidivorans TaxID=426128 RepID=A0A1I0DRP6_9FIRM|nr:ABC transporter permease [Natronincola peptidivorans]SET34598.1 ABC-2 type transport system permease protein [Natronincola peptidivorans]